MYCILTKVDVNGKPVSLYLLEMHSTFVSWTFEKEHAAKFSSRALALDWVAVAFKMSCVECIVQSIS